MGWWLKSSIRGEDTHPVQGAMEVRDMGNQTGAEEEGGTQDEKAVVTK